MKNIIKNLVWVVSSLVVAGVFFVAPVKAQAAVDLDVNGHEAPNVYQLSGKNYTNNPSSTVYGRTINAKAGDTIKLQIHYHNFTAGQVANNVQMAVSVPSGSGTNFTINSSLWAGNSIRTYSDSINISLSSAQSLQFVSGSVVWYPGFNGAATLPGGQSGDTVVSSGVSVGNVDPGNQNSGYIYLNLLVSNTTSGSAPSVTTNSATSIGQTSATLNGSVNPNGASTNYWFEYGTTNSLGNQTSSLGAGSGSSNTSVNYSISGLNSNTTYYFRAVASNSYGTNYGSVLSFTTSSGNNGSAPSVTTNSATSIGQTSAVLGSTVNPNGASTNTWFEYGTTNSLGNQTTSQSVGSGSSSSNFTQYISGLANNTTYYFRAVAQNTNGTTYGSILSFTTTAGNVGSAPSVTTNSATSIGQNSATLNGSVNPNSASTNAWFEYGTTNSLGNQTSSQSIGSGSSNVSTNYSISGLNSNATYYFRAVASNSYGTAYGSILSFTTNSGGGSGSAPSVSTNSATGISQSSANLNGYVNPNGSNTNTWFEYGTSNSLGNQTSSQSIGSGSSGLNTNNYISGLSNNTTYYFRAVASNSYGTAYGSILSFTTNSGGGGNCTPIVTSNSVSFITENSASLLGSVYPNGYSTDAWFEYGTNSGLGSRTSYQTMGSGSSYVDLIRYLSSLSSNTTYYYRAAAQNSCGTSYGSTLSFTTTGATSLPSVNTLLATNVGLSYATLNGSVNPGNSDATTWFEYGTDSNLNTYYTTSSANAGSGNYLRTFDTPVSGLSSNVTYYFRAVARNNNGTIKGSISNFRTDSGYIPPTPSYGSISLWKEVKNLTFPNGTQYVNAASIGDVLEYALNVKNVGSGTISNVTVKDTVSSYYDIVESNPSYVSGYSGGQLSWDLGSIAPNENRVIYLKVKARTVEQSVVVYNSFTASANGGSTKTSNKTTTILNPSMMAMDISADSGVVNRNGTFFYNIKYRNIGINDVDNVVIKVSLPEAVKFISSTPTQSSSDANVYFYRIGRVSRNQFGTISIQARINEDAEIGTRQIATAVLDYNDIFGTPQRNISVSSSVDVGSGLVSLAAGVGFSFGGNWWVYLLWFLIILLVLAIVYLYFRISKLLKNNY